MIVRQQTPVRSRRGLGATIPLSDWCDQASWANPLAYMLCLPHDVSKVATTATSSTMNAILPGQYMPMPNPPPPGVTLSTDPAAASAPGAIPAGTDSSGTQVFAVPQTAQENMAAFKQTIDQYMNDQGNATPPDTSCKSWASIFDPNCSQMGTALVIGGAILGVILLNSLFGGRR